MAKEIVKTAGKTLARSSAPAPQSAEDKIVSLFEDAKFVKRVMAKYITEGDLSDFSDEERAVVYWQVCKKLDLDPFTHPFDLLELRSQNKTILYANKSCTEQLGERHKVSVEDGSYQITHGAVIFTIVLVDREGRRGTDVGAVNIQGIAGDVFGNAVKKAKTQAQRRCVLSMYGLGMLDKTEIGDIQGGTARVPLDLTKFVLEDKRPVKKGGTK